MRRAIWDNLKGLYSLLVGMKITICFLFSPRKTVHYPRKVVEPENVINYRGPLELKRGKVDAAKTPCISCQLCVKACPGNCLTVTKSKDSKAPEAWLYDFSYCCLCGACVETCPTSALAFSHKVYLVTRTREELVLDLLADLKERAKTPLPGEDSQEALAAKADEAKTPEEKTS
ncbi:MAG: 4Fe-4S dicluster domain-containing protein [Deltaproteobacteria bacterium]|jgi:NADH-quinone oxidoreductase subunit I|nr:4Fe-4S dicluster domain-containing protein [Deltaproteobacteria bacterium]